MLKFIKIDKSGLPELPEAMLVSAARADVEAETQTPASRDAQTPTAPMYASCQKEVKVITALRTKEYRQAITESLIDLGGVGRTHDVLELVFHKMEGHMRAADYAPVKYGEARWQIRARWERKNMVIDGLLRGDSKRGIWELTEKGKDFQNF